MKRNLLFPFRLLAMVVGQFSWKSPRWLSSILTLRKTQPVVYWSGVIAIVIAVAGYYYQQTLPKPVTVTAKIGVPYLTENYTYAEPESLYIQFNYDFSKLNEDQERPDGEPSVARIDIVGDKIDAGITMTPAIKGQWYWTDDRRLEFDPETDWLPGTDYQITFNESIFTENTLLSQQSYSFKTRRLEVEISSVELYQDPQETSVRRVVSTIMFTHPIDKESFEKNLTMGMRASDSSIEAEAKSYSFKVTYDENQREAYLVSEPVTLPNESNYMTVKVTKNVKSLLGGSPTINNVDNKVLIPDVYSFLKVTSTRTEIVKNKTGQPEQVLMIEFTDEMKEEEVLSKLSFYILPTKGETLGRAYWQSPRKVSKSVLLVSKKIELEMIPNKRRSSNIFSFKFDAPSNRYLYLKLNAGFKSVNNFVHSTFYDDIVRAPNYPKEIDIAGDGSVLTYSGDHKLSVLSRGVSGLRYSIGKLLEGQLYHLITQTYGDMQNPEFSNWNIDKENLAEFEYQYIDINVKHPKFASYSSLDLTKYLPKEEDRFGLFFVEAQGWDKGKKQVIYDTGDTRLILVTDLGIIVKNNQNQSHELFVQSIQTGDPVAGAVVELLGANGVPIFSGKTSVSGHVSIPVTRGYQREKQPTVYVVKTNNDLSFIPFDKHSRQINLSRFDIGGVSSNQNSKGALNAYTFTSRGIYRPGDEVNVGFIVKKFDLSNIEDIPLEVVVLGPRNNELKVTRITLGEKGFFDYNYLTQATSQTGRYQVSLHLVRDNKRRGRQIGNANFKVEEFQPDTMKIESKLVGVSDKGWSTEMSLEADVTLNNLFGVPAQDRKMNGRMIIDPSNFSFKKYADYTFTDPNSGSDNQTLSVNEVLEQQQTDADGKSKFSLDLQRFKEGTYQLRFIAEGFDQAGGRSVFASSNTLISPLKNLIGHKSDGKLDYINADSKRNLQFIAIDNQLNKVNLGDLRFKKIEIQTVSTLVKNYDGTYSYQTIKKEKQLADDAFNLNDKGHEFAIDTTQPGDFAIEIFDSQQRRLSRVDYSVVGVGNLAGKIDKNAELQVKLNKTDYKPGEAIELSIKAPYSGAGLITIETNRVHSFLWFKTSTESTIQTIEVPEDLEGSAYVNVSFVRDVGSKEIFTSPLSYAVVPFSIDKSKRMIDVELFVDELVRPGKSMEIGFKTSKQSKIAVFVVDEGILQVARYKTPDPLSHFLKKRALGVNTLQILDLILPEFELLKSLSAAGGGANKMKALGMNINPFSRRNDKPAVFWSGIVDASSEKQSVSFDIPNSFAGSLVVMAVAVSEDAMGVASDSTIARGPFVLSPNVLTQAAPGDEFYATLGVANLIEGSGKQAAVEIDVTASEHLEIVGSSKTTLNIDEGGEAKATFKVKVKEKLGATDLIFKASYKNEDLSRNVSLSVRPAMHYYSSFESGFEKDAKVEIISARKMYPNLAVQYITASASPLVLVAGLTSYLDVFPHGCTEQVVSKVFPLVGLMAHPTYAPHMKDIKIHFDHVISKLRERQRGDGGFVFWPGAGNTAAYPTIYAMHFLIEARSLGYPVPRDMIDRGKWYLNQVAEKQTLSIAAARDRANAIYLLTRLGEVTTNYLVDLEEYLNAKHQKSWKQDLLSSYMAATYQLLKKDAEANALINQYQLSEAPKYTDDFHSDLAQDAQYIYLLAKHFETKAKSLDGDAVLQLTNKIFKGQYNTISAAYSILALGAYSKIILNDDYNEAISFAYINASNEQQSLPSELKPFMSANYPVSADKLLVEAEKPVYYLNIQSGYDQNLPTKVVNEGIEINRDFIDEQGNKVTTLEQGKEVTVRLRVRALGSQTLTNIAIVDLLPGGFEVIRSSVSRTAYSWRADYTDIREDRVVYYGTFGSKVRVLSYKVKLTAAGEFVIPPSYAESMYDRSIRSISKGGSFKVTQSQ